jgi:hypothetical protein
VQLIIFAMVRRDSGIAIDMPAKTPMIRPAGLLVPASTSGWSDRTALPASLASFCLRQLLF